MYFVGFCRACKEGLLGVRICGPQQVPCVVCDECELTWPDGNCAVSGTSPRNPAAVVTESELWDAASHWANGQELDALGWRRFVIGHWSRGSEA